jgi:hypothetical protein
MATERQKDLRRRLRPRAPRIPLLDAEAVLEAAGAKHFKALPPHVALDLALVAHVRHQHSGYDRLLAEGLDRDAARYMVKDDMEEVLRAWGAAIDLSEDD